MTTDTYDDEVAVRAYALRHFSYLMTPLERRTVEYNAPIVSNSNHWKIKRLHQFLEERDGHVADDDVLAAFRFAYEERMQVALDRIITLHRDTITQNRCPECNRLVRTPVARQCLWCGHDWH